MTNTPDLLFGEQDLYKSTIGGRNLTVFYAKNQDLPPHIPLELKNLVFRDTLEKSKSCNRNKLSERS
jgi:hypothetical protein